MNGCPTGEHNSVEAEVVSEMEFFDDCGNIMKREKNKEKIGTSSSFHNVDCQANPDSVDYSVGLLGSMSHSPIEPDLPGVSAIRSNSKKLVENNVATSEPYVSEEKSSAISEINQNIGIEDAGKVNCISIITAISEVSDISATVPGVSIPAVSVPVSKSIIQPSSVQGVVHSAQAIPVNKSAQAIPEFQAGVTSTDNLNQNSDNKVDDLFKGTVALDNPEWALVLHNAKHWDKGKRPMDKRKKQVMPPDSLRKQTR